MSQKSPRQPSYCIHKTRGQAYVRLNGVMVYLGPPNTDESRQRYDRAISEWLQAGRVHVKPADKQGISVNEILLAYRQYAAGYYVKPDGTPTPEVERVNLSLRPVMELYGLSPATQFGPKALVGVIQFAADMVARLIEPFAVAYRVATGHAAEQPIRDVHRGRGPVHVSGSHRPVHPAVQCERHRARGSRCRHEPGPRYRAAVGEGGAGRGTSA